VLLPSALDILNNDDRIEKLVVTNTIPMPPEKQHPKIEVLSVASLLAVVINYIHEGVTASPASWCSPKRAALLSRPA
jgi:ribose-phosphate pyrophosphokinase